MNGAVSYHSLPRPVNWLYSSNRLVTHHLLSMVMVSLQELEWSEREGLRGSAKGTIQQGRQVAVAFAAGRVRAGDRVATGRQASAMGGEQEGGRETTGAEAVPKNLQEVRASSFQPVVRAAINPQQHPFRRNALSLPAVLRDPPRSCTSYPRAQQHTPRWQQRSVHSPAPAH